MKWKPADVVVILLTLTVCFVMGNAALMPLWEFKEVDHEKQKLLAGLIGSVLSIVSMYIGAKIREKHDAKDKP
jgi:hypothetical protein